MNIPQYVCDVVQCIKVTITWDITKITAVRSLDFIYQFWNLIGIISGIVYVLANHTKPSSKNSRYNKNVPPKCAGSVNRMFVLIQSSTKAFHRYACPYPCYRRTWLWVRYVKTLLILISSLRTFGINSTWPAFPATDLPSYLVCWSSNK